MDERTETDATADLARATADAKVVSLPDGRIYLVRGENAFAEDVSDPHGLTPVIPRRIRERVVLQSEQSLADYVNRFKNGNSILLADISVNRIVALLDYHGATAADFVDHVATLDLPHSEEWKAWTGMSGKLVPQLEFARFIEENAADVEAPSGADLLEVVRDLQAVRKVDFRKAVRTSSDNENFEYVDETNATAKNGSVEIPTKFALRLPVYFNGATTSLFAFLRWKLDDGQLLLGVKLHRAEHVRQAVFKEVVDGVASQTDLLPVFGNRPSVSR